MLGDSYKQLTASRAVAQMEREGAVNVLVSDPQLQDIEEVAPTLADQIVATLAGLGITTYFGVPGGAIEPLMNALARQSQRGIAEFIPMRSEAGAAFAADGYFRATARMAVCTCTTGPGIGNLITAVMTAHADRVPMLLLTPQVALSKQGRGALQDSSSDAYDLPGALSSCTRYSSVVSHASQLEHKMTQALAAAGRAPKGPVHLSVPSDVLRGEPIGFANRSWSPLRSLLPIDGSAVEALLQALEQASSPLLYIGDDAGPAAHRVYELARRLNARVVSSPAGKRWIGHLDSAYRGVVGFSGHARAADAVRTADLLIAFGATFDELSTNAWGALANVPMIYSVDRHANFAYRQANVRPVIGEPGTVIDMALRRLMETRPHTPLMTLPPAPVLVHSAIGTGDVHPQDLMCWLNNRLPADVVVHVDAGNSFSWSTQLLRRPRPDTYRVAMGLSAMCWAISAAIGAACACGRRTLAMTGDGSMLMSALELTTAVQANLPVTYLILNDSSLGMVRHGQNLSGAESIGHAIPEVRFDQIACACGALGMRVENAGDLDRIPPEWLSSDQGGPCVIDVRIDRNAVPPIGDRVRGLATGVSR